MKKRILSLLLASSMAISLALFTSGCAQKSSASALWEAEDTRNKIVVISDIHIGVDDQYAENVENRPLLIEFLQRCKKQRMFGS